MDDSGPARAALEHAVSANPDARFAVLHVVDDLEAGYGGDAERDEGEPPVFDDARRIAAEHGASVETAVREGIAAKGILEFAAETDVDGIMMGSQGRSGVSRLLLGSVAEAVARRSPVPVTIVPGDRNE